MNDQRYSTDEVPLPPAVDVRRPVGGYADGAEAELAAIVGAATDRSSASEELRSAIHDWPTRYHLSPVRANLLRPLRLGARVLEVGAGTGVLTRWLAEQGHEVLAVEGALARAEVAALRCAGLPGVAVACGGAAEVDPGADGPFDAVLLVGVVEYAGVGGLPGPGELLASCTALLAPGGVVVVAIENQLGLQYLAGAPEDHRGAPGVGVEGYPTAGARTYHRRDLGRLLAGHGLAAQRWLFPYPDYKLPGAVLAEAAFEQLAPAQVGAFARHAASTHHGRFPRPWDLDRAHTTVVGAGLGPDLANSFLVVAGRDDADVDAVVDPAPLAWLYGDDRRPRWARARLVVAAGDGGLAVVDPGAVAADDAGAGPAASPPSTRRPASLGEPIADAGTPVRTGGPTGGGPTGGGPTRGGPTGDTGPGAGAAWLGQRRRPEVAVLPGPDARQLALDAAVRADGDALDAVLARWLAAVDRAIVDPAAVDPAGEGPAGGGGAPHPFRRPGPRALLAPDHLDVDLGNFVAAGDGELAYVDDEWVAAGPVERDLVCVRALWHLARLQVERGTPWPGTEHTTVDELALAHAARAGLAVGPSDLADWRVAERALQAEVVGGPASDVEAWLDGSRSVAWPGGGPPSPTAPSPPAAEGVAASGPAGAAGPAPAGAAAGAATPWTAGRVVRGVRRRARALARRARGQWGRRGREVPAS